MGAEALMSRWSLTLPLFSFQRTGAFEARPSTLCPPPGLCQSPAPRRESLRSSQHPTHARRNARQPGLGSSWQTSQYCCLKEPAQMSAGRRESQPVPNLPGPAVERRPDSPSPSPLSATPPAPRCPQWGASREPTTPGPSCQFPITLQGLPSPWPGGTSGRLPQAATTREEGV
jgi:hypothetical protein